MACTSPAVASDSVSFTQTKSDARDVILRFIRTYKQLPMLWDVTSKDYMNKAKKNEAYDELLVIFRGIKKDAVRDDVKKKINSLRTNYRKELKKINDPKNSGYEPTSWTFVELTFLGMQSTDCNNLSPALSTEKVSKLTVHIPDTKYK